MSSESVQETLDHLFRREFGKIVARLTRILGSHRLDLAESSAQEALVKAVQTWPTQGIPEKPSAWIYQVARNHAIDCIRKEKPLVFELPEEAYELTLDDSSLKDDELKLLFMCCHPSFPHETAVMLTLKSLCGLSVSEIARAFLFKEEAVSQRLVRAKKKIKEDEIIFQIPPPLEIEARLDTVLDVLYLLFNEGYSATEGNELTRKDLCDEAIYRASRLAEHPTGKKAKVFALLALMHLQASRLSTRVDMNGDLLLLEEQDRSLWDQGQIRRGMEYLDRSAEGEELSPFHLQAGIASCHALAPSFETTPWILILNDYDVLMKIAPSPVVELNRTVAIAMAIGNTEALKELERLSRDPVLQSHYLFFAVKGEVSFRSGDLRGAKKCFKQALEFAKNEVERRLISKKLKKVS